MKKILGGLLLVVMAALYGCGGSGGQTQTSDLSGTVTFPSASGTAKVVADVIAPAPTLEIRDMSGTLVKTVTLTLKTGTVNTYTYPATSLDSSKDYVLKAINGSMVLRALVSKAALADTAEAKNVDNISTTAIIVVEQGLALTPGSLGETAITAPKLAELALAVPTSTIEKSISDALSACTSASGTATVSQAKLASLANIVTAAVSSNVDPGAFVAGSSTATFTAVTYTVSGTTATGISATVTTSTAGTFATDIAASLPKISSSASTSFTVGTAGTFTVTGFGTLSVTGILPSGVTFDAVSGLLNGTPATGSNGAYTLTFSASSNSIVTTQTFTLTVNPASTSSTAGFTTEMLSGKTFTEGQVNTLIFNANGTLSASDTQDALTWSVNPSGQIVVQNSATKISTTVTYISGSITAGMTVSLRDSDGTTQTTTLILKTPPVTGLTADMLSGKTFTEGQVNTLIFNANGTLSASDTQDALTWTVNSSGQVVVQNVTTKTSTTITYVSGDPTTGMTVSLRDSDGTTQTTTITLKAPQVTSFTTVMLSGKTFTEGQVNTLIFNANGTLTASDTQDALTWSVNSSGQVVVQNVTTKTSTTVTIVSGDLTTGMTVTLLDSDGTSQSSIITQKI